MYYLYIIKSLKKEYNYVGVTKDLNKRLEYHNSGKVTSTKPYIPYIIVYTEDFDNFKQAREREVKIKSSRSLKQKIIENLKTNGAIV